MTSGKTPRARQSGPGASGTGATGDGVAVPARPDETSVERVDGTGESRHAVSSTPNSRRVTAAAAAAGAAASESTADPARSVPSARKESDVAVAAASAAAAAAVAAVSAAIAATAATRATDTDTARTAPAVRKKRVSAAAAAAGAAAAQPVLRVGADAAEIAPPPETKLERKPIAAAVAKKPEPKRPSAAQVLPEAEVLPAEEQLPAATSVADEKPAHSFPVFPPPSFPATRAGHVPSSFAEAVAAAATPPASTPADIGPVVADTLQPSRTGFVVGKHPELPKHAGLTRFEDLEVPTLPGMIRAVPVKPVPVRATPAHQATEPLFSNEGVVRESGANHQNLFRRLIAVILGVAAALAAAGTAFGHGLASHLRPGKPAAASEPAGLVGAAVVDLPAPGPTAAPSGAALKKVGGPSRAAGLAAPLLALRARLALGAGAVVAGATAAGTTVARSLRKIGGRDGALQPVTVEADSMPAERRRRRAPIFWLVFGGFFVMLYGSLVLTGWVLPSMASSSSDPFAGGSSTPAVAGVDPTATWAVTVTPGGTLSPTATTGKPTPSASPTSGPTVKPTPKPTPKPTAKPKPKPTPKPTPVDFVTFYAQGASDGANAANYTMVHGTSYTATGHLEVIIKSRGTSTCTLSANGLNSGTLTVSGASSQATGYAEWVPHAKNWAADQYPVTASCTLNGFTATATHTITIT